MMNKKYLVSLMLIFFGFYMLTFVSYSSEIYASYHHKYHNITEMSLDSDLIIIGYVSSMSLASNIPQQLTTQVLFTDNIVTVTKILKGVCVVKDIIVRQTGGIINGIKQEVYDDPLFQKDVLMLLFLKKFDDNKYFVIGGPQGRYEIHEDRIFSFGEINEKARSITKQLATNGIYIEDLINKLK
ncbi:hypothetical protein JW865_03975 [Candidatus Bathyarchaeota archaeon]|nr:hypothetical protein [Candidatus Bathyarchaeota archaeon]